MQLILNCLAYLQGFKEELKQWDVSFWAERLREAKFNITDEELRPYFALPNVLKGLFQVGHLLPPHHTASPSCCIPITLHPHHAASPSRCIPVMLHPHHAAPPYHAASLSCYTIHPACYVLAVLPCCVVASSCRIKPKRRVSSCMLAASEPFSFITVRGISHGIAPVWTKR